MDEITTNKSQADERHRAARLCIDATSIGRRVPQCGEGRVAAVFQRAVILQMDADGVVAILSPHLGQVAHGIKLTQDEAIWRRLWIGMPARVRRNYIALGDGVVLVTVSAARPWSSNVRVGMLGTQTAVQAAHYVQKILIDSTRDSASEVLAQTLRVVHAATVLQARVSAILVGLAKASCECDADGALLCLRGLIGLGPGLTPAGDDFIVGWLAGLTIGTHSEAQLTFLTAMCRGIEQLSAATTPVSRQHLLDACALMFSERLSDVCIAVAHGAPRSILESRLRTQLAVGATSGADAAAGLIFALFNCKPPSALAA